MAVWAQKIARGRGWRRACACLTLVAALALLAPAPILALKDPEQSGWTRANSVGRQVFDVPVLYATLYRVPASDS